MEPDIVPTVPIISLELSEKRLGSTFNLREAEMAIVPVRQGAASAFLSKISVTGECGGLD
jgi:hypothetical protein